MNKRNGNLKINHCLWERSDLNNLVDISQEHRANFNDSNLTCQKASFKPQTHPKQINKMVPRIQQACRQNDPTMINTNFAQQRKPIEPEFIKQYSIPTRITCREKLPSQKPNWRRGTNPTKASQAKEVFRKGRKSNRKDKLMFFQYYY